ncbi:MAG: 3-phosphoshikimate 1-carboxyvinyltransferase [Chlamydiota bacterium]|nr:3-phosphoshikimate 1-carboxyvinyltransferase [Chlamydiota bacterium]
MQRCKINKSTIEGMIEIPASKSQTIRAIMFASLAEGESTIRNFLNSPDTFAIIHACESFGATITQRDSQLDILGVGGNIAFSRHVIDAGNSGLVLRFMTGLAAHDHHPVTITGDKSIRTQRQMQPLIDALGHLKVKVISTHSNGLAPLVIQGPLSSGKTSVVGADSQFVSSLLIACAFANGASEIQVASPGEKPWVDLTLHWFDKLGIKFQREGYSQYFLEGNSIFSGFIYTVPGDLSSLAFPVAAALIGNSSLKMANVDLSDQQGDKRLIDILIEMGAKIEFDSAEKTLTVNEGSILKGITVDINDCIDSITILAVLGCYAEGTTKIVNASVAKIKECNRIECVAKELSKMGANIQVTDDGIIVQKSKLHGAEVESHKDHRMAMSLAVAAMQAEGETTIQDIACVQKTYPSFFVDFQKLGANFSVYS